jgi:hypothetical protein
MVVMVAMQGAFYLPSVAPMRAASGGAFLLATVAVQGLFHPLAGSLEMLAFFPLFQEAKMSYATQQGLGHPSLLK